MPFSTWLLMGFFKTIPRELEDAALVDGASRIGTLLRIVFPISLPGILTVVIFSFSLVVNEFVYAITFISTSDNRTVSAGVPTELIRGDVFYWGALMAAALLPEHPSRPALQRVPRPLHRRVHRWSLPLIPESRKIASNHTRRWPVKDKERVQIVDGMDELTRRDLLRKAGLGAVVLVYGGAGVKNAVAAVPKYRGKELAGTLRIMQWSHFVPAYDRWFDDQYVKAWGQNNDTEVKVDHVNLAELPTRAAAEVASQSGHDLFQFLSPPAAYEDQVVSMNDIVQEVTRKIGPIGKVGRKSTYNPRTKKYFGFPDNYVPDPVHYRRDIWAEIGRAPNSWEDIRIAAPRLKAMGRPVGIGMSQELDSNMAMIALMQCYGGYIQNAESRVVINSKGTREALRVMRDIYKNGMTSEVFAWTAASNNTTYVSGRLSLALNAISIARTLENSGSPLADRTWIAPIPRGPSSGSGWST